MLLNEVARQTGVYTQTLRYKAQKLFGRRKGEFTEAEVDAILSSLRERTKRVVEKKQGLLSEDKDNKQGLLSEDKDNKGLLSEDKDNKGLLSEEKDNKSVKLDPQLVLSIDRLLQFKIPHWKDYDKHLQVLNKLLLEVAKKGAAQYERDLIEAQQLAEEYNQWLDEQIEGDYLDGFKSRVSRDLQQLEQM